MHWMKIVKKYYGEIFSNLLFVGWSGWRRLRVAIGVWVVSVGWLLLTVWCSTISLPSSCTSWGLSTAVTLLLLGSSSSSLSAVTLSSSCASWCLGSTVTLLRGTGLSSVTLLLLLLLASLAAVSLLLLSGSWTIALRLGECHGDQSS